MKRPTVASLKKVTPENLKTLGAERLAELLSAAAEGRPDLKRRLRMELAAEQGAEHLLLEVDKRLNTLAASRSKVSWRQRPAFVRDVDSLRTLITSRLATLDSAAAMSRMWILLDVAAQVAQRVRDRDGALEAVFARAATDLSAMLRADGSSQPAASLVEAVARNPTHWAKWLPRILESQSASLVEAALTLISARGDAVVGWMPIIRQMADAAGQVDAYRSTFTEAALKTPAVAAEVARRLLAAGRLEEARAVLEAGDPCEPPDFSWETVWIDYLEQAGRLEEAQQARWSSFERTLSGERAKAFTRRLADFEDVEAESRAFAYAADHPDLEGALRFLIEWPALPEAARMIQARSDEIELAPALAELWADQLRNRQPQAAHTLLRKAAAAAFRRRDFATCDRLTREADALTPA